MSIHLNADISSTWHGAQVFYDTVNAKNKVLAKCLQETYIADLNTKREYKNIKGHYLYGKINIPGVLIEVGFITNSNDRYKLKSIQYQRKFSKSTIKGIINYFESD